MAQAGYISCSGCGRVFNRDNADEMTDYFTHGCDEIDPGAIEWADVPNYMCWNCGSQLGVHKESPNTTECYCMKCLEYLVKRNAGGDNPFN
jgi:DNA-directed RNA polymerase subunit RPC12/RpoP